MATKFLIILSAISATAYSGLISNPMPSVSHLISSPITYGYQASPAVYTSHASPAVYTNHASPAVYTSHASPATIQVHSPAVASSYQNIVRSHDGTVSHYSKAEDTAFSKVRKHDTRINNNVYTPLVATKTLAYSAPVQQHAVYTSHASPVVYTSHESPAVYTSHASPAVYASHASQAVYAAPSAHTVSKTVSLATPTHIAYSPVETVAHVSFEGPSHSYGW